LVIIVGLTAIGSSVVYFASDVMELAAGGYFPLGAALLRNSNAAGV
jgi:hypothetical protein